MFVSFSGFNIIVFLSGKVARVLKMLVFPVSGALWGWLLLVYLGLEGLVVFVFLVFAFVFGVGFVYFVCFVLFCGWMLLFLFLLFCFYFVFCLFFSFVFLFLLEALRVR